MYLGPVAMGVLKFVYVYFLKLKCSSRAPGYFTLIGDMAPPATSDSSEVARILSRRCYPHAGNGGRSWCLSSSLYFPIHDEAMDVARSAPQGARYHVDVIYLLP